MRPNFAFIALFILIILTACGPDMRIAGDAYREKDYDTAFKHWHELAEFGHEDAQLRVGLMYLKGQGIDKNLEEAKRWLELVAVRDGNERAHLELGLLYADPDTSFTDIDKALYHLNYAANAGAPRAYFELGSLYMNGEGVEKDAKKTVFNLIKASKIGYPRADYYLGYLYEKGELVEQDLALARSFYEISLNGGYERAADALERLDEK